MSFFRRLFKFRIFKFRTTLSEELEDLHSELIHLQKNIDQARLRQKQWTRWFAIYIILAYLLLNIVYYLWFLSQDVVEQLYEFLTSIALGILLYGIHWTMRWYFRKTIQAKEDRLALFKERKQELIEEVKNKETYAVAKSLLEKYGEKITPEIRSPIVNGNNRDISQRVSINPNAISSEKPVVSVVSPRPGPIENGSQNMQTPIRDGTSRLAAGVTPGKLPRAILPPQRTFWGTMLDTIVGDGPSKRYALICKSCNSHNGMALEEEFEYLSYRCAYCNYFNGARKQKPVFNPNLLHSPQVPYGTNVERMEISGTESSDSAEPIIQSRITRRSIRVPATNENEVHSRSRSMSLENKRQTQSAMSSSEESLSEKNK